MRYPFMPGWSFRGRSDMWLPCLQAERIPGGPVVRHGYEEIKRELLDRIRAALPLDGFYLDIHGAMNVLGMDDAEGDLAAAIRDLVGPALPDLGRAWTCMATFPRAWLSWWICLPPTGSRPTMMCCKRARKPAQSPPLSGQRIRPLRAWVRIPVILPGERTSTLVEPGKSVYASLHESDLVPGILDASLWVGYVWADEPRSSASVVVTGTDAANIRREAEKIARRYWDARETFAFGVPAGSADWCIEQAMGLPGNAVVISDSGDNPTAGGVGDIPYFVSRLLAHAPFARGQLTAIYASIPDPAAVAACFAAGIGRDVDVSLGGKLDPVHAQPFPVHGTVAALLPDDPVGGRHRRATRGWRA